MTVQFLKHVALEIPASDCERASQFYADFGLTTELIHYAGSDTPLIALGCEGRQYSSIFLIPGAKQKKLHHVAMGTNTLGLEEIRAKLLEKKIPLLSPPSGFSSAGLWFSNPHGLLFHVEDCPKESEVLPENAFTVNSPGHYNRINAGALPPKSSFPKVIPKKLGHALLFTPDVDESINFLTDILGMRLSDRAQDIVAFTHCQGGSDHHVIALAKSSAVGFHHASFMVTTPDQVGFGGCHMESKGYGPNWGFGRHAIGSNFFHYVRDPWGSYVEYYSDIDYIRDSETWEPKNWPLEDSLHTWGPNPPEDFVHNYECTESEK